MKKTIAVILGLLIGSQAFADPWHGARHNHRPGYSSDRVYNYHNYHNYNNHSRGEWRHTHHNGQLAWWFVVGSMFYLSEQAYLNDRRNYDTVIVNPPTIYNPPVYINEPNYSTYSYRPNYGWYCETTGRFSRGTYDTCPIPWISRPY